MSKYEQTLQFVSGFFNPLVLSPPNHRQRLFPFALVLSERIDDIYFRSY
ncbi:MAG: hypothetical protein LBD67_05255 [Candidatus Accumulibacter sp.]|nr:hypothetical protein [Accumulibacter sp.]